MTTTRPNLLILLGVAGSTLLLIWPLWLKDADLYYRVIGLAFFYGTLAFSWNLFALTGAISLGHAAFFGLGAYGSALASHYWHLSPFITIVMGGLLGSAYGILWNIAFRRLQGPPFALATLASAEIPRVIIDNWDSLTFGSLGIVGISNLPSLHLAGYVLALGEDLKAQYYMLLCVMLGAGWMHKRALTSRWGWAIRSIREDEIAASSLGVNVFRARSQALLLSAFLTALCGGIYAHLIGLIEPALVFSLHVSALPLILSIFGGRYQSFGPALGALVLYPADQILFHSWLPSGHAALYGLVVVATLLFFPQGLGSWLQPHQKPV